MAREATRARLHTTLVVGGLFACACTGDKVIIGAEYKSSQVADGGAEESAIGDGLGSVGCTGNASPATSSSGGYLTIDVNGTTRQYVLELPTGYDGNTPAPVLIAFHGSGTSAQDFLGQGYGNVRTGAAGRVLLVGPNALVRSGETTWIDPSASQNNGVTQTDIDFFDALVAHLTTSYCIDSRRIFAMGHGDGAVISNQLACVRGNVLRGVGPFAGAGPDESGGSTCVGKVAAFIGHNPKEGDATECAKVSGGSCPWTMLWSETGWPSTQYWSNKDSCSALGTMPTAAFAGNSTTGDPLPCQSLAGCDSSYPVTLCLYDYSDQYDGPHAFPVEWGAKAATDFFLALP